MVSEDRRLRLAGYEVYRFGAYEFLQDDGEARASEFFDSVLARYDIAASNRQAHHPAARCDGVLRVATSIGRRLCRVLDASESVSPRPEPALRLAAAAFFRRADERAGERVRYIRRCFDSEQDVRSRRAFR